MSHELFPPILLWGLVIPICIFIFAAWVVLTYVSISVARTVFKGENEHLSPKQREWSLVILKLSTIFIGWAVSTFFTVFILSVLLFLRMPA